MMPTYWVEFSLEIPATQSEVEKLVSGIDARHAGHVTYTFSSADNLLTLALVASDSRSIEDVLSDSVDIVRAVAQDVNIHAGQHVIGSVSAKMLDPAS